MRHLQIIAGLLAFMMVAVFLSVSVMSHDAGTALMPVVTPIFATIMVFDVWLTRKTRHE